MLWFRDRVVLDSFSSVSVRKAPSEPSWGSIQFVLLSWGIGGGTPTSVASCPVFPSVPEGGFEDAGVILRSHVMVDLGEALIGPKCGPFCRKDTSSCLFRSEL